LNEGVALFQGPSEKQMGHGQRGRQIERASDRERERERESARDR
jgi:hypothetical protein